MVVMLGWVQASGELKAEMQGDGFGVEATLTPRMVTSHQCILSLFFTRGDLPKGSTRVSIQGKSQWRSKLRVAWGCCKASA